MTQKISFVSHPVLVGFLDQLSLFSEEQRAARAKVSETNTFQFQAKDEIHTS